MIGVVSSKNGRVFAQRGREVAGERPQPLERRAELGGQRARLRERLLGLVERAREQPQRLAQRGLLRREGLEVRVGGVHEGGELLVAPASAVESSWKLWITRRMFWRRAISSRVIRSPSRAVGSKRLKISRRSWAACS